MARRMKPLRAIPGPSAQAGMNDAVGVVASSYNRINQSRPTTRILSTKGRRHELAFRVHQVLQQRADCDHAYDGRPLHRRAQGFVMHEAFPNLHDIQIAVLNLPELSRLQ